MLQSLRDYFPRWLMTLLLGTLVIAMVFLGVYSPQGEESKSPHATVVKVNGKTIRRGMVDQMYERLKQQEQAQLGANFKMTAAFELQLRRRALMQLVTTEMLKQNAYAQGLRIHPDEILQALKQIPLFQVEQRFSADRFEAVIQGAGYTRTSFLSALEEDLLINQLSQGLLKTAFILPSEFKDAIRLLKQQRDFTYVEIEPRHFMPSAQSTTEAELRDYYDHHLSELRIPEQVSIDYIMVALSDVREKLKQSHHQLQPAQLRVESEKQFANAIDTLTQMSDTNRDSLTAIAKTLNVPIQSTALFSREGGQSSLTRHPDVIAAAFNLDVMKGRNSPIISLSSDRVIVLRVKQHQEVRLPTFEAVKSTVQEKLRVAQSHQAAKAYGEQLVKRAQHTPIDAITLPAAMQWKSVHNATRYGKQAPAAILNAAFKVPHPKHELKTIGLTLSKGRYAVIKLLRIQDGHINQLTAQQKKLYQEELAVEKGQFEYEEYVRRHIQQAKISHQFNPS